MLTVAIIGRTNVGKSTLFNKLSIGQKAIVHDSLGVTIDYNFSTGKYDSLYFKIIDTPGGKNNVISEHTELAHLFTLVLDHKIGVSGEDLEIVKTLRKNNKNFILLVNKYENTHVIDNQYYKIAQNPIFISAEHGVEIDRVKKAIRDFSFEKKILSSEDSIINNQNKYDIKISIVGKPNTGKSTFINSLSKKQVVSTSPIAGTTIDSIYIPLNYKNKKICLIDTAGIRRKSKITKQVEKFSISHTLRSIKIANIIILMLDATQILYKQDWHILNIIHSKSKGIIIVVNKIDLLSQEEIKYLKHEVAYNAKKVSNPPVVYISSLRKKNVNHVIQKSILLFESYNKKISTHQLNKWLQNAIKNHNIPYASQIKKQVKLKYCTQINKVPIKIKIFTNFPKYIPQHYITYLTNSFIKYFDLFGTSVKLQFEKSKNPYL